MGVGTDDHTFTEKYPALLLYHWDVEQCLNIGRWQCAQYA